MKKFFKTTLACMLALLIVGLILPIVGISIIAGVVASSGADSTIEKNSVLFLDLNGVIEERAVENPLASIMDDEFKSYGLDEIIAAIKEAKANENIKGIYLQTVTGADARAIYEGEVTWCAPMNGNYAVIVQHGNYRSVYSPLKKIYVKQGDKLTAKQAIGEIYTNTLEDNKTELYFQIYKDRSILNPGLWLAQ